MRKLVLAVGVLTAALTLTTAAVAQTTTVAPYPGPTPTTLVGPTTASLDLGTKPCPSTFDVEFRLFNNDMTQSEVDGINGDDQRPTNGTVVKSVEAICPVPAPTALGAGRALAATGLRSPFAQAVRFARIKVNGRLYPPKPLGSVHTIVVRGTGLNGAPRVATATFRLGPPGSTTTRSGLARTGTMAAKWAPFGIGLLGVGYLLVLATRRRRSV